jgi:D-arabinonate dehydratase
MSRALRIVELRGAVAVVPLEKPLFWSTAAVAEREYVLVWAVAEDGSCGIGWGLGSRYPGGAKAIHDAIQEQIAPVVVGADAWMTEAIWSEAYRRTLLLGRRGGVLRALSAVDIALWDLKARAVGRPLLELLGGHRREVPVYASGGYYSKGGGRDDLRAEIEAYLARGFRDVKIKIGAASASEDVARVRLVRELIGPEGRLALDANNAWTSLGEAVSMARRLEAFDPWWLEEPFSPDAAALFRDLSTRTAIPLATGELEATRWPFRQFLDERSVHILQPDATVCGGVTEWRRIAAMAAGFDVPVAPHWAPELHIHLVASTPNGLAVEYFTPDREIVNFDRLLANPLNLRDGYARIGEAHGHGVALDLDAVRRYLRHDSMPSAPLPEPAAPR